MKQMKYFTNQRKWLLQYNLLIFMLVLLLTSVVLGWAGTNYLGNIARQEILENNESSISLISANMTAKLRKIESAAMVVSGSPQVIAFFKDRSESNMRAANAALDRYNSALNASISYLMDERERPLLHPTATHRIALLANPITSARISCRPFRVIRVASLARVSHP
jgi:hypothetical protein